MSRASVNKLAMKRSTTTTNLLGIVWSLFGDADMLFFSANYLNAPIVPGLKNLFLAFDFVKDWRTSKRCTSLSQWPNKGPIWALTMMMVVMETKIETMKKTKQKRKWKKEIEIWKTILKQFTSMTCHTLDSGPIKAWFGPRWWCCRWLLWRQRLRHWKIQRYRGRGRSRQIYV